ncbi:Hypothetical predicted protein [Pelobates cultripes]|uniref:Uncharacterized protein n=1 Tax=Pelobates cultripes TaxID=61616 RepID=A0AAD1RBK5_PELCU|nr:Hypothetical predicted protein [Pelobates cultripes]
MADPEGTQESATDPLRRWIEAFNSTFDHICEKWLRIQTRTVQVTPVADIPLPVGTVDSSSLSGLGTLRGHYHERSRRTRETPQQDPSWDFALNTVDIVLYMVIMA